MIIKVNKRPYEELLFNKTQLELKPNTISCFVGCNGTGKTTLINYVENYLQKQDAYEVRGAYGDFRGLFSDIKPYDIFYFSFDKRTEVFNTEDDTILNRLHRNFMSTGESIINRLGESLYALRQNILKEEHKNKSLFVFFDDCDAGTSIDMINDIKQVFNLIIEDCKQQNITYYIILTANSFEMCRDIDCISVHDFSHHTFTQYEDFKKFVVNSRKKKEKRYKDN